MKEMVEVSINEKTGRITVTEISPHYTTQGLRWYHGNSSGLAYHCEKGTEDKYIKKMFKGMLDKIDDNIHRLEKQRNKLHVMYDKYLTESKEVWIWV